MPLNLQNWSKYLENVDCCHFWLKSGSNLVPKCGILSWLILTQVFVTIYYFNHFNCIALLNIGKPNDNAHYIVFFKTCDPNFTPLLVQILNSINIAYFKFFMNHRGSTFINVAITFIKDK